MIRKIVKYILHFTPKWLFNFFIGFKKNSIVMKNEIELNDFYKDKGKSCLNPKRKSTEKRYDLKIVVPCYNTEPFVEQCIKSILKQKTKYKYLVVLINDGSKDKTLDIIKKYESDIVKIVDKENGGPSSARNKALEIDESNFLMFVDSDDSFLDVDAIDLALDLAYARKEESFVIEFDYSNSFVKKINVKKGLKSVDYTKLTGFPWGKIFTTNLFRNAEFPSFYWYEDTLLPTIILPMAEQCFKNKTKIYFYRPNLTNITHQTKVSDKALDTFYVTRSLLADRKQLSLVEDKNYFYRFYMQVICNCVRLQTLPVEVQLKVFYETIDLFKKYNIREISTFSALIKSFKKKNFSLYFSFCNTYSRLYLNL